MLSGAVPVWVNAPDCIINASGTGSRTQQQPSTAGSGQYGPACPVSREMCRRMAAHACTAALEVADVLTQPLQPGCKLPLIICCCFKTLVMLPVFIAEQLPLVPNACMPPSARSRPCKLLPASESASALPQTAHPSAAAACCSRCCCCRPAAAQTAQTAAPHPQLRLAAGQVLLCT